MKFPSARLAVTVAIVATVVIPRLVVLPISVLDWDESSYAMVAQHMLWGHMPYETVFDHKPVGLYLIFAGFFAVLGDTVAAIRTIPIVFVSLTAALLAWLCHRQFGLDAQRAALIAALYGLLTMVSDGLATNTELLINLFVTAAIATVIAGKLDQRVSIPYSLLTGAALGAAFQINYLGGIFAAGVAAFYLVWMLGRANLADTLRLYVVNGLFIFLAFAVSNIVVLLPIIIAGDIREYFALQSSYLSGYDSGVSWQRQLGRINDGVMPMISFVAIGAVFVIGMVGRLLSRQDRSPPSEHDRLLRGWTTLWVFSLLAASASGRFFPHFFLFMLPSSLMLAAGVLWHCRSHLQLQRGLAVWMLLVAAFTLTDNVGRFTSGLRGYKSLLAHQPADPIAKVSAAMASQLQDGDTIFAYDADLIHYFQTRTLPPTRFAFPDFHLKEADAARVGIDRAEHMRTVLAKTPKFIVVNGNPAAGEYGEASEVLANALESGYEETDLRYTRGSRNVVVFRRRTPIEAN